MSDGKGEVSRSRPLSALRARLPRLCWPATIEQQSQARRALEAEVARRQLTEEALLRERTELAQRLTERNDQLARATAVAQAALAAVQEANRLHEHFLAKASHELRTPLQSTLSWAQVLRQSTLDPARTQQAAERIMHNVNVQADLIDQWLDTSAILHGKLHLRPERLDAGAAIRKAAHAMQQRVPQRHVRIDVSGEEGQAIVLDTDPARFDQVMSNLMLNAVQASPDRGRVAVQYQTAGDTLVVEVQDWGKGIETEELARIFEPFRQGPGADLARQNLGAGLAITRSIVDMIGGQLHAHSDGPGQGAIFTLKLPLATAPSARTQQALAPLTAQERAHLAGLHVLYVEDDPAVAEGGRQILESLGMTVTCCGTYHDAARQLTTGQFDMMLSDLNLGAGHTALDLLTVLRSMPQGRDVPALVLSAYGSEEDRQASERAGFAGHVIKPLSALTLAHEMLRARQVHGTYGMAAA